jgi:protein-S-isoprenylcysteine O-methyltransferase Ste14
MDDVLPGDAPIAVTPDDASGSAGDGAAVRFPFPPLLFAGPLAAGLIAHRMRPLPLPLAGHRVADAAGMALVAGGIAFSLSGAVTALRRHTTVVPHHAVSQLVTSGPFRITRNPMYTGMGVACVGAALWAGSAWPLLVLPLSVRATVRWVVEPEEAYLERRFDGEYDRYRRRVRRWGLTLRPAARWPAAS